MPRNRDYVTERDRDLFEEEEAYFAWLEGKTRTPVVEREVRDDSYDPDDPYDRLTSEGGHLGE